MTALQINGQTIDTATSRLISAENESVSELALVLRLGRRSTSNSSISCRYLFTNRSTRQAPFVSRADSGGRSIKFYVLGLISGALSYPLLISGEPFPGGLCSGVMLGNPPPQTTSLLLI